MKPQHGGPDAEGVSAHDFSTNANACGPCPPVLAALRVADATCYPDPQSTALRERLGAFHGVAPARIVTAASGSEFIFRITALFARQRGEVVQLPRHAYGDYARAAQAWDLALEDPQPDDAGIAGLRWCCDPSSPLGLPEERLDERVDALPPGAHCVLDLAYEPLRLEGALQLGAAQRDRVWQLWTPNKALGLTGVRAAYAIAPRDAQAWIDGLDEMAPSWPLGAHGVALLQAWTFPETQRWLAASLAILRDWKQQQLALCRALGWPCQPGVGNFFTARPTPAHGDAMVAALRARGIRLRDTASFGLSGQVRLAVLPPASQAALREAVMALA